MGKHGCTPPRVGCFPQWRQTAFPVLPGAALLGATSQVYRDVRRVPSSNAEPLRVPSQG